MRDGLHWCCRRHTCYHQITIYIVKLLIENTIQIKMVNLFYLTCFLFTYIPFDHIHVDI